MQTEPHVVIVGGGFSGAAVAIHLLRLAPVGVRVTLLEPREVPGAGVAYSTTEPSHRINVPAARMQLAGEEEGAFDRWYRSQPAFADDPHALLADGAVYPQRGQFGRYVAQRFAEEARASGGRLTHLREQALSVNHGEVVTDGGRRLQADLLVLAISHPPPSLPSLATPFATHPALIANPWRAGVLATIAPEASVAVMGTGLTMADTVATLTRLGHRGPIAAFSRRGLLSR
ncbi:FAD/NAD(P)-binding protein, partial [Klebsiella michiganensis]